MQSLYQILMSEAITNYLSKLDCFQQKELSYLRDLGGLLANYNRELSVLSTILWNQEDFDREIVHSVVLDIQKLTECLYDTEDLILKDEAILSEVKKSDTLQFSKHIGVSLSELPHYEIKVRFNNLAHTLFQRNQEHFVEIPLIERFKNTKIDVTVQEKNNCFISEVSLPS